jgi:DNA-binding IclR family transcriptional regulator
MITATKADSASAEQVRAVTRALDIVEALGEAENGLSLAAVRKAVQLPHATVHRLLHTLEAKQFVSHDLASDCYFLSPRVLRLQATLASRLSLVAPAVPVLARLLQVTGYTANLAVLDDDRVVYVETRFNDEFPPSLYRPSGRTNAVHATALGKVLVAYLPTSQQQALVSRLSFEKRGPHTITDPEVFLDCLAQVRRDGYAVDNEEATEGARCVAAPVRDHKDRVVAAVSVASSTARLPVERVPEVAQLITQAADDISSALGWARR